MRLRHQHRPLVPGLHRRRDSLLIEPRGCLWDLPPARPIRERPCHPKQKALSLRLEVPRGDAAAAGNPGIWQFSFLIKKVSYD
eukprot:scaffold29684_cov33-Prasinocladus_malaysianus.AAC.1